MHYNRLQRPCAFLDAAHCICRIYPVRPMVCRFFFNLSPAEWYVPNHVASLERQTHCLDPYHVVKKRLDASNHRLGAPVLNFLSGAFVTIAGQVMQGRPLKLI